MRRKVGLVVVALGMFLVVLAPMARFYAYPRLAVVPVDQDSVSVLEGPGATVFDIASLSEIQTDLTTTAHTVGDIEASADAPDNVAVWVNTSSTKDSKGVVRSRSIDRVAFDRTTGMAVNCCDEYYETVEGEQSAVEHEGLVYKFPFNTQKKTYPWWDSTLREPVDIEFDGVEQVEGLTTYRFTHTIEPTVVATSEVPASVVGAEGDDSVEAERVYSNVRTLWAEPQTGVVIKRTEQQNSTLRYEGEDVVTTTQVDTGFNEETIKANADEYGPIATQLNLLRNLVPLIALVVGLLLTLVGMLMARQPDRPYVD